MKTFKKLLAAASLVLIGLGASAISSPASAAVNCPKWPSPLGTNYALNGHIYNCMPTPRNGSESALQQQILNRVNAAVADFTGDMKTKFNAKNVDIVVSYNAVDGYAKANVTPGSGGEPASSANESGRSWVLGNKNATIVNPTSMIFVYTQTQWSALGGAIPTSYNSTQVGGTLHHELGHQIDRVWAQYNGWAPAATAIVVNNSTNANYGKAVNIDGQQLTAADITTIQNNYPRLLQNSTTLNINELFAEEVASVNGGGANASEDSFISTKFRCSQWFVTTMKNTNGVPPAAPNPGLCNNKTVW